MCPLTAGRGASRSRDSRSGATSLADLGARMEYLDAVSEADADLANEALNVRAELEERRAVRRTCWPSSARYSTRFARTGRGSRPG